MATVRTTSYYGQGRVPPPQVIHFSTLSVDYHAHGNELPTRCTLQLIEHDTGTSTDFYSIQLHLILQPRPASPSSSPDTTNTSTTILIDDVLTLRHLPSGSPNASVGLYARGARPLGSISFPNGPEACQAFILALRAHAVFTILSDPHMPGTLYGVDAKPRMRRAAPTLMPLYFPQPSKQPSSTTSTSNFQSSHPKPTTTTDDEFSALLSDLNISSPTSSSSVTKIKFSSSSNDKNGHENPAHNFAMGFLSKFALVTQVARDLGDHIQRLTDEERRRSHAQQQRLQNERRLSSRLHAAAMDIHAAIVASTDVENELPPRLTLQESRGTPISPSSWKSALNADGTLLDARVLKYAVLKGGISSEIRCDVWPFVLGIFEWGSNREERSVCLQKLRADYEALKRKTEHAMEAAQVADTESVQESEDSKVKKEDSGENSVNTGHEGISKANANILQIKEQIAKDVIRTDRHIKLFSEDNSHTHQVMSSILTIYAMYNPSIGYCQGMSDFLSPVIHEIGEDEALAFWCFERLMRRMEANFRIDQSGMHAQLGLLRKIIGVADDELMNFFSETDPQFYSCFRWIVVRFKREMPFQDVTTLWEVLWASDNERDGHIYVAAGLLLAHRTRILRLEKGAFDSLLRYINDMSMRIDVDFAIHEGEECFKNFPIK